MLTVAFILARWAILAGPAILAWLWIVGSREDRSVALATAVAAALGLAFAAALSPVVAEPRPFVDGTVTNYLGHAPDGGFPSDHATLAFALAFGLWFRRPPLFPRVWIPLVVVAVAIGWGRVFLGSHHPIDIIGGAGMGLAAVMVTAARPGTWVLSRSDHLSEALRSRMLGSRASGR